jgi:hypothetical protein
MRLRHLLCLVILISALPLFAQTKTASDQKYLLLSTSRTSTMQKELDAAAAEGFRVLTGSGLSGDELALLLERMSDTTQPMTYRLLATSRTGTMERELNDAANEGFRMLPRTLMRKGTGSGGEIIVVMERAPGAPRVSYKLLATSRTGTLQKELSESVIEGYEVLSMVSRGENIIILEKSTK